MTDAPCGCDAPQTETKTIGLWDRDVCEIFVAPEANAPERYFEFEAAPTGEWLDLAIDWKPDGRIADWEYDSGMQAAGRIGANEIEVLMCLPWRAFGREPRDGDVWRVNLFRCVGRDTEAAPRGYITWQPTHAPQPNFHVPAAFGRLAFTRG
jgi:alpha-galactosidase